MALWETGFEQRSAEDWMARGEEALRIGNHGEAESCFNGAIEADPFNALAYTKLSSVYRWQGKHEDSLSSLSKALELQPGDRDTVLECASVFTALGKEDFAKEVLDAYLEKNPRDVDMIARLDELSMKTPREGSPEAAEFFNRQGEIRYERGNVSHARACFEMAIEEDPRFGQAYNNLGVIDLVSGKTIEALKNFHKALDLDPEDEQVLINSARGLVLAAQVDAAIDVYREYLRRVPADVKAWEEFEALIRQSVRPSWKPEGLASGVADIYRNAAEQLLNAGDLSGAFEALGKALGINPRAPDSLYLLACLHSAVDQKEQARSVLDRVLAIDPAHAKTLRMVKALEEKNGERAD